MSFTAELAEEQVVKLMREERWDEALDVCRRVADELHEEPSRLGEVLEHVSPATEQLRAEDAGSALWLLGFMYLWGYGGVQRHREEAFRCFSRAAGKGHLLSRWRAGYMTVYGYGVPSDEARGYALMVEAAKAGCTEAFYWAGKAYHGGWGVQQSYRRAAQWYLKGKSEGLYRFLRDHPLECAPLGEWRPELTSLVPPSILQAMRTAMLVCKRKQLPRYVALLIASYVCTE